MKTFIYDKAKDTEGYSDFNGMSLEDFLIWSLDGAKQAYEINLPAGEPEWSELDDDDKVSLLAWEITSNTPQIEVYTFEEEYGNNTHYLTIWTDGKHMTVTPTKNNEPLNEIRQKGKFGFTQEKSADGNAICVKDETAYLWIQEENLFPDDSNFTLIECNIAGKNGTWFSLHAFNCLDDAREYMVSAYQSLLDYETEDAYLGRMSAYINGRFWHILNKEEILPREGD